MTVTGSECELIIGWIIYITGMVVGYMYGRRDGRKENKRE